MNQPTFPIRGLLWKEMRLVVPLILLLLGVTVLLLVLWSLLSTSSRFMALAGQYIPLWLPILYAAGVGAILIGQERENRTLMWFTSLPISSRQIFWTKLLVALVGLGVMWLCCLPFVWMNWDGAQSTATDGVIVDPVFWFLESVFLTLCSIYTAWRFKNTYASLVAIIPFCLLPLVVAGSIDQPWQLYAILVVLSIVAGWRAYRAGMTQLAPAEPEPVDDFGDKLWLDAWRPSPPVASTSPSTLTSFRYPLSSLFWQSIHHNLLALIGLVVLLLVSLGYLGLSIVGLYGMGTDGNRIFGLIGLALFSCWLGGFAFTGDGTAKRMRFLADRGIAPLTAWLGRHMIGASLLSVALLIYAVMTVWIIQMHYVHVSMLPSIAMVALAMWTLYGVSQWTSQLIRMLPAAVVIAPIFAGCSVYWLGFAASQLQAPLWCIVLCSCIPMLATLVAMRQYMDDTSPWRLWIMGFVSAAAFIVIPMLPAAYTVSTWPSMPSETRASVMPEAELAYTSSLQPQSMMQKGRDENAALGDYSFSPSQRLQLGNELGDMSQPLAVDMATLKLALEIATYQVQAFEAAPNDETRVSALGEWIESLTEIVKRLRLSPRWLDQQAADGVEIWLTQTLGKESLRSLRDQPYVMNAIELLGDSQGRSLARRRAVLASWYRTVDGRSNHWDFGGMNAEEWASDLPALMREYVTARNASAVVDRALQLIAAGDAGQPTLALRRELHALTTSATIAFEDGPYSDRLRVGGEPGSTVSLQQLSKYPANQWYAAWETDARNLATLESLRDVE